MYEPRTMPMLTPRQFAVRVARHLGVALAVLLVALFAGMVVYHTTERLDWLEAFLNAAMLLGGMGPVDVPRTWAGKLGAGLYALFAGLVFVGVAGVLIAPWAHRLLHRLHLADDAHDRDADDD